MLSEADKQLADARDAYFDELPTALWRQLFGGLTTAQRGDLIVALVQLAGALLLSYSLVANLCLACTATISWGIAASRAAASPLASAAGWSSFLTTHSTIRLLTDAPLWPLKVFVATAVVLPRYRRGLSQLQRALPVRQPVIQRALSFAVAWLLVNVGAVAILASGGVLIASVAAKVSFL